MGHQEVRRSCTATSHQRACRPAAGLSSSSSSFLLSLSAERSNLNLEDAVESAVRPPGGHQCNGVGEDSGSESSSYSENSRTVTVGPSFSPL